VATRACRSFSIRLSCVNLTWFSFSAWRHWGCVTPKIIENLKKTFSEASEVDGYDDLSSEDRKKLDNAWEEGHVADEDIPESAKKTTGEDDEEKPKRKKAATKKTDEEGGDKPKKSRATKAKVI
jgi:Poly(ADP-ribose) polymerase and DNA-Ligase Zn-finger region